MSLTWLEEPLPGGYRYWRAEGRARTVHGLQEEMVQLRAVLADRVLPLHRQIAWDYVRAEFWPSSGRLIVFPARHGSGRRDEIAACELTMPVLLAYFDAVTGASRTPESMGRSIRSKLRTYSRALLGAWKTAANPMGEDFLVELRTYNADDEDPLIVDEVPASSLGLLGDDR